MYYKDEELKKYFDKISKKKITNRIINDNRNKKLFLSITILFAISMVVFIMVLLFKNNINYEQEQKFIATSVFIYFIVIFFFIFYLENKGFNKYSFSDKQFYLIYLFKKYLYLYDGKHSVNYLYSINRYYINTLYEQIKKCREINYFIISENENMIRKICNDFKYKVNEFISNNSNINELNKLLEILLAINYKLALLNNTFQVNEYLNVEISKMFIEYNDIIDVLTVEEIEVEKPSKYLSTILNLLKNKLLRWVLIALVMVIIYLVLDVLIGGKAADILSIIIGIPTSLAAYEQFRSDK